MKKYAGLELFIFGLFAGVIGFTFSGLFRSFFQQDEWYSMGPTFVHGVFAGLSQSPLLLLLSGQGRLFGSIINNAAYYYFPFRVDILVWFALIIHTINTFLWYKVVHNLTGNRLIGIMSALFFAVAYVPNQAVTWFASIFTTLPSATFIFISLLLYFAYHKKNTVQYLFLAQGAAFVAYMFKESAMFIFLFIPFLFYCGHRKISSLGKMIKFFAPSIIYVIFILIIRIHSMFSFDHVGTSFVTQTSSVWERMIFHAIFYSSLSSVQLFIPPTVMFALARYFQSINYGAIQGYLGTQLGIETVISDFVSFILFVVFSIALTILYVRTKNWRNTLLFGVVYILLSFLPFIILNKGNAYLDSRYFYNSAAGGGLLLSVCLYIVYESSRKYCRKVAWLGGIVVGIVFLAYIGKNIQLVRRDIQKDVMVAQERKQLLFALKSYYPVLPVNAVVYMTGNTAGYYGLPELKIPLQQGPGYTIMTWYYATGSIPDNFLSSYYLWNINDEGYRSDQGKAFGYFWNKESLIQAIQKYSIRQQQLVGFYYDSNSKKLMNITNDVRKELQPYFHYD